MYWEGYMGGHIGWSVLQNNVWSKGPWTAVEDRLLIDYVRLHGEGKWNSVASLVGLKRNGKSCRLRWVNYLRPDLKRGQITSQEESIIVELHNRWGNRWSIIAKNLPGRTDNEINNYWRTHFKKKVKRPFHDVEKAKYYPMRRKQKFHQQQQKQKQQPQQQQIQQQQQQVHQQQQERIKMYPNTIEEQGYLYSMFNDNNNAYAPEVTNDEISWNGLWNMDDVHGNFSFASATNKVSLQSLVAPFC